MKNKRYIIYSLLLLAGILSFSLWQDSSSAYTKRAVILDGGHGGYDSGAFYYATKEKDLTLDFVKRIQPYLEKENITVILTRQEDEALGENEKEDLKRRVDIANQSKARYFVSLHLNASKEHTGSGYEIYCNKRGNQLAQSVSSQLNALHYSKNRGIFPGNHLYVLRKSKMSSILIEAGFLDNAKDHQALTTEATREKIAKAIAEGIIKQMDADEQSEAA